MGYGVFFGSLLVAFGPAVVEIWALLWNRASNMVVAILSACFWLFGFSLSGAIAWARPDGLWAFLLVIPISVLFQEGARYLFYRVYVATKRKLEAVTEEITGSTGPAVISVDDDVALSIGVGIGITHTLLMYSGMLAESWGPGALFAPNCPGVSFFFVQAVWALAFQQMHVFLNVIAFDAYRNRWIPGIVGSVLLHIICSSLSMLNLPGGNCVWSFVSSAMILICCGILAFWTIFRKTALMRRR